MRVWRVGGVETAFCPRSPAAGALIALYNLPEDDLLGFTHAFFPAYAFDEHVIAGDWAFARKDDGYLALHAANGMKLAATGNDATASCARWACATPGCVRWVAPR